MWKSMRMTAMGMAAAWCGSGAFVEAQSYLPPTPYGAPYQTSPTFSADPMAAPYGTAPDSHSRYGAGLMTQPAMAGGYSAGGAYTNGYTATGAGPAAGVGPFWAPGGYEARIGSPYLYHDPNGGQFVNTGNPYHDHFGPGYHRNQIYGHYRFPYYNYRAPWYYPGRAVYNRDTNLHW